jgi:hypothetical protein
MFGRTGTHYYTFDLLMLDSTGLRPLPLVTRNQALRQLIADCDPVRYCDYINGYGRSFFEQVRKAGLEGMVAKRRQSPYIGGPTTYWLKIKCLRTHDFVVSGWRPARKIPFALCCSVSSLLKLFIRWVQFRRVLIDAGCARSFSIWSSEKLHHLLIRSMTPMLPFASRRCGCRSSSRTLPIMANRCVRH